MSAEHVNRNASAHLLALFTAFVWGTTFVSTKVLLRSLSPLEILLDRFVLGYAALLLARPKRIRGLTGRDEGLYAACGLLGVCSYYMLENLALTMANASSVGLIVSVAPIFVPFFSKLILRTGAVRPLFYIGFALAIGGIALISFNGTEAHFALGGDLLALAAAVVWSVYSVLLRKLPKENVLVSTRHIFFYGILWMLPFIAFNSAWPSFPTLIEPQNLWNMLYLGIVASAVCFVTWGYAVGKIGPARTSVYLYLVPAITFTASAIFLGEKITAASILGVVLVIGGLIVSERAHAIKDAASSHEKNGAR